MVTSALEGSLSAIQPTDDQVGISVNADRPWLRLSFEAFLGIAFLSMLSLGLWYWSSTTIYQPYAYWCVIMFGALRYGPRAGLVVAGLAIGMQAAVLYAIGGAGSVSYQQLGPTSLVGLLVAIVSGELSEERRRSDTSALARVDAMAATVRNLSERYASATEVISALEHRVAGQSVTVATVDEVARRLEVFEPREIYPAVVDVLRLCLPADAVSVYLQQDGSLVSKAHVPLGQPAPDDKLIASNPVVQQVLATGKVRHIRDQLAQSSTNRGPEAPVIMAAPLLDASGRIVGVVTIERMPFLRFNPSAVRLCEIIVSWASRSLRNALLFADCSEHIEPARPTSLLTFPQTMRRLWQEAARARRHRHPLSVLVMRVHSDEHAADADETEWRWRLAEAFAGAHRAGDTVGRHRLGESFISVLPETPPEAARVVAERLMRVLRSVETRPVGRPRQLSIAYGIAELSSETPSTAALIAAADAAVRAAMGKNTADWTAC